MLLGGVGRYLNVKSYFLIYKSCFFVCVIILMFLSLPRSLALPGRMEELRCEVLFVLEFRVLY